jgi:hypothetical protein
MFNLKYGAALIVARERKSGLALGGVSRVFPARL